MLAVPMAKYDLIVDLHSASPISSNLNVMVRSPNPLGWIEIAVGLPEDPRYSGLFPN